MTAEEFEAALRRLGDTRSAFARSLGMDPRTVQNWLRDGPPTYVAALVSCRLRWHVERPRRDHLSGGEGSDHAGVRAAFLPVFERLYADARRAGWADKALIAVMDEWLASRRGPV
ncbi:hypothetical protein WDZ92_30310 [Nostoc sp. NIES-2111]